MLKDKIVVITGASKGLGKALAEVFSKKGATVIISDIDTESLEEVAEDLEVTSFVADVTKEKDLVKLREAVLEEFGQIDIWINNAGVWLPLGSALDLDMKRVHDLFEINVFGVMNGSRVALPQFKNQGNGMLVNIMSTRSFEARGDSAAYVASKHATKGFTDSLRIEFKDTNINIIGIYPDGMKTELFNEKKPDNFADFMDANSVAEKIVANLEQEHPEEEQIIKRPGQE